MSQTALSRLSEKRPAIFDNFFKPWNEFFGNEELWNRTINVPAVNIKEGKDEYSVSLAAPGLKKDDFRIDVEGDMLTISCEKEETKEEKEKKFTRKEYNYSSFSRSFTLPADVNREKIDAHYSDGVLNISLPRKANGKKESATQITVK